jgi:hypothetical protein
VEHESSKQTIWEHEMTRDICLWKKLAEAAWAAHERRREFTRKEAKIQEDEPKRRHREKGMPSACEKCTKLCSRNDDDEGEGNLCYCQCMSREENSTAYRCARGAGSGTGKSKIRWSGRGSDNQGHIHL